MKCIFYTNICYHKGLLSDVTYGALLPPRRAALPCLRYIGLPTTPARYQVLHSCVEELVRVGIVAPPSHLPPSFSKAVELTSTSPAPPLPPPHAAAGDALSATAAAVPTASLPGRPSSGLSAAEGDEGPTRGGRGGGSCGPAEQGVWQGASLHAGWENGGGGGEGGLDERHAAICNGNGSGDGDVVMGAAGGGAGDVGVVGGAPRVK